MAVTIETFGSGMLGGAAGDFGIAIAERFPTDRWRVISWDRTLT